MKAKGLEMKVKGLEMKVKGVEMKVKGAEMRVKGLEDETVPHSSQLFRDEWAGASSPKNEGVKCRDMIYLLSPDTLYSFMPRDEDQASR